jgi:hypothetical protein
VLQWSVLHRLFFFFNITDYYDCYDCYYYLICCFL